MAEFFEMASHRGEMDVARPSARVVLSRLPKGESLIQRHSLSLKYVLEGEEYYVTGGRSHRVLPGQILLIEPGAASMTAQIPKPGGCGLCIYLPANDSIVPAHFGEMLLEGPVLIAAANTHLGALLTRASRRLAEQPDVGPRVAATLVNSTSRRLAGLLGELDDRVAHLDAVKPGTRKELLRRVEVARSYLHDNHDRTVTLQELARRANTSTFHLARAFQRIHGVPPATYHRNVRLEVIAKKLARDELALTDAADQLGFADQASFTKAFRRRFGKPPGAWMRAASCGAR